MAETNDPWADFRDKTSAVAAAAPIAATAPAEADPWADFRDTKIVQPGETVYDPGSGMPVPGAQSQPTTTEDVAALKRGLYGNDARGAALAGATHFLSDIPVVGPALDAATDRAAAALQSATGGGSVGDNTAKIQAAKKEADTAHPIAGTVGGVAGNVAAALPVAALAPAALGLSPELSVAGNALRATGTGGAVMGTDAAVKDTMAGKDFPTTARDVIEQGGIGAATMGATPVVGKAVGALAGALSDKVAQTAGPLSDMDSRALNWAVTSLKNDRGMDDAAITKKFDELGPNAFLAEFGPNTRGAASAIASMPGEGQTTIRDALQERAAGTPQRIEDAITSAMGPRVNVANLTREGQTERSDAARDLYDQWRTMSIHPTDELKALMPRLQAAGAFNDAAHKAALEGIPWNENFFTGGPQKSYPTAQTWDYVKRALDDKIAASKNPMTGENTDYTRIYTGLKNDMMGAIENSDDEGAQVWKQARQAWGDPTSIMRARTAGQGVWNPNVRRDDLLYQLTDYSQPERNAFKQGARDSLAEMMDKSVRGDTNVRNMLLAPANQDKLDYLATNKNVKASDLVTTLEQEARQTGNKGRIADNSESAARLAGQAMLTPDPSQTLVSRFREAYSPHVMPGAFLMPKAAQEAAARSQAASFENSRSALAPMLMKQGPEAASFAKALLAHQAATTPSQQISPAVAQYVQMLATGAAPRVPAATQQYLPQ